MRPDRLCLVIGAVLVLALGCSGARPRGDQPGELMPALILLDGKPQPTFAMNSYVLSSDLRQEARARVTLVLSSLAGRLGLSDPSGWSDEYGGRVTAVQVPLAPDWPQWQPQLHQICRPLADGFEQRCAGALVRVYDQQAARALMVRVPGVKTERGPYLVLTAVDLRQSPVISIGSGSYGTRQIFAT